jgi:hypothetical protein
MLLRPCKGCPGLQGASVEPLQSIYLVVCYSGAFSHLPDSYLTSSALQQHLSTVLAAGSSTHSQELARRPLEQQHHQPTSAAGHLGSGSQ